MGTLGTFDSFTTARLGIYAAQHGLRVTGNNISNINTAGYTRQRVDQVSFKTGGHDRYASQFERHIGSGALVTNINQIRDPYLDIRYRTTSADTAYADTKLSGLEEIAAILDEVGKGGSAADGTDGDGLLYAQLQDLAEKLRSYGASPTKENDTLVRGAAEALTSMFRNYATRLEQVRKDTEKDLNKNIDGVNEILTNIRSLNKSIRDAEIHGDKALELRDERNRQIDELSKYMHIKVEYTMEDVGAGVEVEKLTISLGNANPDPKVETDSSMLVDGLYATQLSIPEKKPQINPDFDPLKADPANPNDLKRFLYLKDDGTGTNKVEEAKQLDNDNYTIQLGKLLDAKGVEWKDVSTNWADATGGTTGKNAVYSYAVTSGGAWDDGDELKIGNNTFKVGEGAFTKEVANSSEKLAAFVASELSKQGGDYYITANGANIVYTAKQAGAIGSKGPQNAPDLTLVNGGTQLTLDPPVVTDGVDSAPPGPNPAPVVDEYGTKTTVAYTEVEGKWFQVTIVTKSTREIALDDNDLHGSLQAQRELLTEEGEFSCANDITIDENAKTKRGIPYYQKSFDLLAQQIAKQYNELNQGFLLNQDGNYIDKDGNEILLTGADAAGNPVTAAPINKYEGLTPEQARNLIGNGFILKDEKGTPILDKDGNQQADLNAWLKGNGGVPHEYSGPLFSNSNDGDDTTGITASNIDVSHSWSAGDVRIVPKYEVLFNDDVPHTTQNINVNHMISMIDKPLLYDPKDIDPDAVGSNLFTGCFNDMFSNMMGVQANDARITNIDLNTNYTTLVSLDSSREGVSGVDLNDEAMNMMQFQKAMNAAMRLMTAIDEALDRLINNTGIAGR